MLEDQDESGHRPGRRGRGRKSLLRFSLFFFLKAILGKSWLSDCCTSYTTRTNVRRLPNVEAVLATCASSSLSVLHQWKVYCQGRESPYREWPISAKTLHTDVGTSRNQERPLQASHL